MPQSNNTGAMTIPEKVVDYIGFSSAALEKAAAQLQHVDQQRQKVAALIPAAVDALISGERIDENQRAKAAEALRDPVKVLEILTKVAVHRNTTERTLGQPVTGNGQTKTAGANGNGQYNSLLDPCVGARTTRVKQSSVNLFTRLGLQAPSEE
jgi:hypothetical protein